MIKNTILFITITLFSLTFYNKVEARDCTNPKGFHAKMACKLSNIKSPSLNSGETSSVSNNENKKKGIGGLFNAIKNLGGDSLGKD
mgnify:FL=1